MSYFGGLLYAYIIFWGGLRQKQEMSYVCARFVPGRGNWSISGVQHVCQERCYVIRTVGERAAAAQLPNVPCETGMLTPSASPETGGAQEQGIFPDRRRLVPARLPFREMRMVSTCRSRTEHVAAALSPVRITVAGSSKTTGGNSTSLSPW